MVKLNFKNLIGYEPRTTFEQGIKNFVEWYKENRELYEQNKFVEKARILR